VALSTTVLISVTSLFLVRRYATEGISLACQYAYRNATPGSTLAGNLLSQLVISPSIKQKFKIYFGLQPFFPFSKHVLGNWLILQMSISSLGCRLWSQG
jgi:hypothetical protein